MNTFAIAVLVAAFFVAAATASPKKHDKQKQENDNVPVLTKGKSFIIRSEKNNFISGEKELYKDEPHFKEGKVHVELKNGNMYVNSIMMLKQDPSAPVITKNPHLKARNIMNFEIKIDEQGEVTYVLKTSV